MNITKGPWQVGEFDEYLGYDCMTSGIRCGPTYLDGASYGQKTCMPILQSGKERMIADAHLIAAAPELFEALEHVLARAINLDPFTEQEARAALDKARGGK